MTNDGGEPPSEAEPFGTLPEGDAGAGSELSAAGDEFLDDYDIAEDDPDDDSPHTALPPRVETWRRRSATGAILTGFALGLQQALGKEQEQPAIIMQTSGDPPADLPVDADVERGRPRQSVVNIRPWLLPDRSTQTAAGAGSRTPEEDADGGAAGGGPAGEGGARTEDA